jgi:small subunit ribosomal protein S5
MQVPLAGTTIPFMVKTNFGASEVLLKPAAPGTGVIAGGAVRAVMESAGVRDILTKTLGSTNKANTVQACLKALRELRSADTEALQRGKTVVDIVGKKQAERIAIATATAAEQAAALRAAREEEARETRATSNRRGGDRNDRGDRRGSNSGGSDRRGSGSNDRGDRRGGGGGDRRR